MNNVKYELKYCERCGTLKLRPISSTTNYCLLCERLLSRYRLGKRAAAAIAAGLPAPDGLKTTGDILLSVAANPAGRVQ
jgi:hypothetical protein